MQFMAMQQQVGGVGAPGPHIAGPMTPQCDYPFSAMFPLLTTAAALPPK